MREGKKKMSNKWERRKKVVKAKSNRRIEKQEKQIVSGKRNKE